MANDFFYNFSSKIDNDETLKLNCSIILKKIKKKKVVQHHYMEKNLNVL